MKKKNIYRSKFFNRIKSIVVILLYSPWLIILYLTVSSFSRDLVGGDQLIISNFIEWFGTAYSLFLALVLVNVWAQFDTIDREFDREIDAIATLYQMTNYTQTSGSEKSEKLQTFKVEVVQKELRNYVKHVLDNYKTEHIIAQQRRNGELILERIGMRMGELSQEAVIAEPLTSELFRSLNEAMDVRGDRISHSKQRTPGVVQIVAIAASIIWLLSFFGLVIEDRVVSVVLIGGATFVIFMVLNIINDLDNPFDGTWNINLDAWHEFLEIVDPSPHIIFVFSIGNGLSDRIQHLLGHQTCKLYSLLHSGPLGLAWRGLLLRIWREHPFTNRDMKSLILYKNQWASHGYAEHLDTDELPYVCLKLGDKMGVLLNKLDVHSCVDLSRLEDLLKTKINDVLRPKNTSAVSS